MGGQCRGAHFRVIAATTTPARLAPSGLGSAWSSGSTALERQRPRDHSMVSSWHLATRSSLRCFAQSAESSSNKAEETASPEGDGSTSSTQEAAKGQEKTTGADAEGGDNATSDTTKEASASGEAGASEDATTSGKADAAEDEPKTP